MSFFGRIVLQPGDRVEAACDKCGSKVVTLVDSVPRLSGHLCQECGSCKRVWEVPVTDIRAHESVVYTQECAELEALLALLNKHPNLAARLGRILKSAAAHVD